MLFNRRNQLIFLILLTLIAYINILKNGFAWDDRDFFIDWPQIKSEQGSPAYLSLPYLLSGDLPLNHRGVYRPLRSVYYLASYALWGENPFGYHLQAIIVHILIVLIIYLIIEIITKKRLAAFISAILFAAHPIHTEAVTFATASMDNLGILFFFLSFYLYLRHSILASILYASLAFLTYETTLVLPILIVLYDFSVNNFSIKKLISKVNIYKYYFLALAVYLLLRFIILGIGSRADYLGDIWAIAANQGRVSFPEIFRNYLSWLILPINLSVTHFIPLHLLYGFLKILEKIDPTGNLTALSTRVVILFPIFYASIVIYLLYLFFRKHPLIFFGFSWLIISLLPVSSIFPQGAVNAERFLYIPSFGFTLILGILFYSGISNFYKKGGYKAFAYVLIFCLGATVIFYTYKTIIRNADWRDEKTIWEAAIKVDPTSPLPYGALAKIYFREGKYQDTINLIKKVVELNAPSGEFHSQLALAYELSGQIEKAVAEQQEALKIDPGYFPAHVYLGNIYLKQKRYDLAEKEYKDALKIKKNDPVILKFLNDLEKQKNN